MSATDVQDLVSYVERERARMPRSVLESCVLGAFQRGVLSRGRAAELLGLSLRDFLRFASAEGIPVLDVPLDELAGDIERA